MLIKLTKSEYELAKTVDFSKMENYMSFRENDEIEIDEGKMILKDYIGEEYEESCINVFLDCITTEIDFTGLADNQNEVLSRGRALYDLHDNIYDYVYMQEQTII